MTLDATILEGLSALEELVSRAEADPLNAVRWLTPQDQFLRLDATVKLYRAGNQALGKSTVGLAEVRYSCLGDHPHLITKDPPVHWVVCSLNQAQSLAIQGKFYDLLPADCLDPKLSAYNVKTGFGANKPVTVFRNGSTVKWITDDQGPRAIAGWTGDGVLVDEPCGPEMWRELKKRVMIKRGRLIVTFTPINGPTQHFRDEVDAGQIAEVHAPLTVAACRYADTGEVRRLEDGTLCDQAWIDEIRAQTHPTWAPIVNDGLWEMMPQGVWYDCFDRAKHRTDKVRLVDRPGAPVYWALGIDYAAADRAFGHVAALVQCQSLRDAAGRVNESIYIVDEVTMDGTARNLDFAEAVIKMLDRNGLQWRQLTAVHGDNPVESRWVMKSNDETMKTIATVLGLRKDQLHPRILNAKDGPASGIALHHGNQYLYSAIKGGRLYVHPQCERIVTALESWDYTKQHPMKDVIDAVRYALKPWIAPRLKMMAPTMRVG